MVQASLRRGQLRRLLVWMPSYPGSSPSSPHLSIVTVFLPRAILAARLPRSRSEGWCLRELPPPPPPLTLADLSPASRLSLSRRAARLDSATSLINEHCLSCRHLVHGPAHTSLSPAAPRSNSHSACCSLGLYQRFPLAAMSMFFSSHCGDSHTSSDTASLFPRWTPVFPAVVAKRLAPQRLPPRQRCNGNTSTFERAYGSPASPSPRQHTTCHLSPPSHRRVLGAKLASPLDFHHTAPGHALTPATLEYTLKHTLTALKTAPDRILTSHTHPPSFFDPPALTNEMSIFTSSAAVQKRSRDDGEPEVSPGKRVKVRPALSRPPSLLILSLPRERVLPQRATRIARASPWRALGTACTGTRHD